MALVDRGTRYIVDILPGDWVWNPYLSSWVRVASVELATGNGWWEVVDEAGRMMVVAPGCRVRVAVEVLD
jgi:hypothetical protein